MGRDCEKGRVQWAAAVTSNLSPSRALTPSIERPGADSPVDDALIMKEEEADGNFRCVEPVGGGSKSQRSNAGPYPLPLSLHPVLGRNSRCMGFLKLAQLLNVVHQVTSGDILHHKI